MLAWGFHWMGVLVSDLREQVAKALHEVERGGCWDDEDEYHKQDFYNMAEPAIALVLEEAAKVAEFRIGCDEWSADTNSGYECASREIAADIRKLKERRRRDD